MRARLEAALRAALKERDTAAVSALRSALAAIGNAEAVQPSAAPGGATSQYIAGSVAGLRSTEASRRTLSEAETADIVTAEIAERHAAADSYQQAGHPDRAQRLWREADALAAALAGVAGPASG